MSVMLARRPDGREPESDYRGRIGAAAIPNAGGAVNADRSSRPSLPCPPSWRGLPRLPGAPNPLRTPSTVYHSPAPLIPPPCPYPYLPYVRLHCTMPCYGTSRVCVLECPPLGRPSLIKLVLVNKEFLLRSSQTSPRRTSRRGDDVHAERCPRDGRDQAPCCTSARARTLLCSLSIHCHRRRGQAKCTERCMLLPAQAHGRRVA